MKQSTPTSPKPPDPLSILLIGPPGGGKTTLEMSFPSICVCDCDENLDGPERFLRSKSKDFSYSYERIRYDDKDLPLDLDKCYDGLMEKLITLKANEHIKTVAVDSLTSVNEFIIQKILRAQRRGEMEARDWIPFKSRMLELINRLRGLGKTSICAVHESKITEPDPKNMMNKTIVGYEPSIQGSIVDYFGGFFTDMWRCTAEAAPGGLVEFRLQPIRSAKSDLKNSVGLTETIKIKSGESMFEKVAPFLKGRI